MSTRMRVLPSILNGVSRQPALLRAADQNEEEINTWAEVARGLAKRPPTEYVAKLLNSLSGEAFIHQINRDVTERYIVVIDAGVLKVFDAITGAEKTVNFPHGSTYLTGGPFRAVTVADYTFIVNTSVTCDLRATGADTSAQPASAVWLNKTPSGSGEDYSGQVAGTALQYPPNPNDGTYAGEVASLEKLPETAADGTLYKVSGSVETGFTAYWVVRRGAVWDETREPGLANALKETTMPYALVREGDGTFTFAPFSWAPRRVGDLDTNPAPTFIGRKISDVFLYQNRLGLLVDENVVFSCAGDFGNFWRNTVLDYVASDVIDVAVSTANVALLKFAVPHNGGVILFADQVQFSLDNGESGLTPASVVISPITRYEINLNARPVTIGTEIYFAGDQNGSSALWEYTLAFQGDNLSAAEITSHVPSYLPANLRQLAAAPNARSVFALTQDGDVYVYQFYWNGNEKVMSAWRKWTFDNPVRAIEYTDGALYLAVQRSDGVYLERVNIEVGAKPTEQNEQVYLDGRVALTGTYRPLTDDTLFTFPYPVNQELVQLVRPKTDPTRPGSLIDPSTYTFPAGGKTVVVPGNVASATGGETYVQRVVFSRQFPLDFQGRPITTGRMQLRTFTINYADTAYFETEVAPYGTALAPEVEAVVPAKLAEFTGRVVGADALRLNAPVYHTGSYTFQVYGDAAQAAIAVNNPTHCGFTLVSAEWEGLYYNRATP